MAKPVDEEGVILTVSIGDKGHVVVEDSNEGEDQHSPKGPSIRSGGSASAATSKKLPKWYLQTMKDSSVSSTWQDLSNGACVETKKRDDEQKIHREQVQDQVIGLTKHQREDTLKKELNRKKFRELLQKNKSIN
eukprot:Gb_40073 [translate_table: standard]